jgi:hypothetical protein
MSSWAIASNKDLSTSALNTSYLMTDVSLSLNMTTNYENLLESKISPKPSLHYTAQTLHKSAQTLHKLARTLHKLAQTLHKPAQYLVIPHPYHL